LELSLRRVGVVVLVVIWVDFSAQIVLFGAEFTHFRAGSASQADAVLSRKERTTTGVETSRDVRSAK